MNKLTILLLWVMFSSFLTNAQETSNTIELNKDWKYTHFSYCETDQLALNKLKLAKKYYTNIIIIPIDDLGWGDLGCYGNKIHETSNIDRFAKESIMFTNAYAAAPVCTPTRASLMTGKYPSRLHMTTWSEDARKGHGIAPKRKLIPAVSVPDLPLKEITIAEVLKEKGFKTIHIGKWHLGESMFYPENQGFDLNIGGGSWGCPATYFYPYRGKIYNSQRYIPGLEYCDLEDNNYFKDRKGEYLTDRLTDKAIKIIKNSVSAKTPFFLNLCYYSVHVPTEAPDSLVKYYKNKITNAGRNSNPVYAAMIHKVDQNVGRILKTIRELHIEDNTVIVVMSDNGGFIGRYNGEKVANNSPLRSGKGSLYEGGIRIPMIIKLPNIRTNGMKCNAPVISNDIFPTLCDLSGIRIDSLQTDGISLLSLIRNPEKELKRKYLFWHFPHYYTTTTPVSAVRCDKWKLIKYYEDNSLELYNLENDIGEMKNIAKDNPEQTRKLLKKLDEWLKETHAMFPLKNPEFAIK